MATCFRKSTSSHRYTAIHIPIHSDFLLWLDVMHSPTDVGGPRTLGMVSLDIDDVPEEKPRAPIQKHPFRGRGSPVCVQKHSETRLDTSEDESSASPQLPKLAKTSAHLISRMMVLRPELLRVMPAYRAFENFAVAFRPRFDHDLHYKSLESDKIAKFWSHSWHGGRREKITTLLMLYNGTAAVSLGSAAAFLMLVLFTLRLLPGIVRRETVQDNPDIQWSVWCMGVGFLVTVATFLLWRPQEKVFFDRICINSTSRKLKIESIFSLAGILKSSGEMLILWDATWSKRLWCVFELAAFLKSKEGKEKALTIRPTFLGPSSMAGFLTAFVGLIPVVVTPLEDLVWPSLEKSTCQMYTDVYILYL